jgi:hypothetical protein
MQVSLMRANMYIEWSKEQPMLDDLSDKADDGHDGHDSEA